MKLISQLIKSISRAVQKLIRYFNGNVIETLFIPAAPVLLAIFCLNLNETLLLLSSGKSIIASLASKASSSLKYYKKRLDVFE